MYNESQALNKIYQRIKALYLDYANQTSSDELISAMYRSRASAYKIAMDTIMDEIEIINTRPEPVLPRMHAGDFEEGYSDRSDDAQEEAYADFRRQGGFRNV
jgi:hypothetical protein